MTRWLQVKELEHRKVKRLAGEILGQRGDVEAFFLQVTAVIGIAIAIAIAVTTTAHPLCVAQALDEVRSRVAAERAMVRSSSSDSTFLTQADSYGIKASGVQRVACQVCAAEFAAEWPALSWHCGGQPRAAAVAW